MKIVVLILAAGHNGFDNSDGGYPLCLSEFDGVSLIERIITNTTKIPNIEYIFALLEREIKSYHLDRAVKLLAPNAKVASIPDGTMGSACTALLGASQLNSDDSLLIVSANELVDLDLAAPVKQFIDCNLDAGTLIFRSIHPRYSYVTLNNLGLVSQAAQKNPISHHATAGVFWFRRAGDYIEAAKNMISKCAAVDGKFYVAPTFNELILKQKRIGVFEIANEKYHPIKTEWQLHQFESGSH